MIESKRSGATRRDRTGDLLITKFRIAVYAVHSRFGVAARARWQFRPGRHVLNPILNPTSSARARVTPFLASAVSTPFRCPVRYGYQSRTGRELDRWVQAGFGHSFHPPKPTLIDGERDYRDSDFERVPGISGITILHLDFPRAVGNRNRTPSLRPPPCRMRSVHQHPQVSIFWHVGCAGDLSAVCDPIAHSRRKDTNETSTAQRMTNCFPQIAREHFAQARSPIMAPQRLAVITLMFPIIAASVKRWRLRATEQGRCPYYGFQPEHRVLAQKLEQIVDTPNVNVVYDQQRAGI